MAAALRRVLVEPGLSERMTGAGRPLALECAWPAVAGRYRDLADRITAIRAAVAS
jgi:hypothetical protein